MFKFGFSNSEKLSNSNEIEPIRCEEFLDSENLFSPETFKQEHVKIISLANSQIKYLTHAGVMELLNDYPSKNENCIIKTELSHSDLIPSVYEGNLGFGTNLEN